MIGNRFSRKQLLKKIETKNSEAKAWTRIQKSKNRNSEPKHVNKKLNNRFIKQQNFSKVRMDMDG